MLTLSTSNRSACNVLYGTGNKIMIWYSYLLLFLSPITVQSIICNLCTENVCSKCEGTWCINNRNNLESSEWCTSGFDVERGCYSIGNSMNCAHNTSNDLQVVRPVQTNTCYDIFESSPCAGQGCYVTKTSYVSAGLSSTTRGCTKIPRLLVPQSLFPGLVRHPHSCSRFEYMQNAVTGFEQTVVTEVVRNDECACSTSLCNKDMRLVCQGLAGGCSSLGDNNVGKVVCHQGYCNQGVDCQPLAQCSGTVCGLVRVTSMGMTGSTHSEYMRGCVKSTADSWLTPKYFQVHQNDRYNTSLIREAWYCDSNLCNVDITAANGNIQAYNSKSFSNHNSISLSLLLLFTLMSLFYN